MSFQDMGRKGPSSANRNQHKPSGSQGYSSQYATGSLPANSENSAFSQISEAINQYQRNVGILDKIVQQLSIARRQTPGSANFNELQVQYNVQLDVVTQLEERVKQYLKTSPHSSSPQLVKLKRDFERVQARVQTMKADAEKFEKIIKSAGGANDFTGRSSSTAQTTEAPNSYQQMQLQIQQDRLTEEVMREREEEIRNINRGMHQVNEIYKDLAHIVGSQQEQIDTIETQMEESRANAEQGLKQVEKANERYGNSQCTIS